MNWQSTAVKRNIFMKMETSKLFIKFEEPGSKPHPHCPHGPTLYFYRNNKTTFSENYYACSAHRDKKSCSFYLQENLISDKILQKRYPVDTNSFKELRQLFLQNTPKNRNYCHNCQLPFTSLNDTKHKDHEIVKNISNQMISNPTIFLKPLDNDQIQAQYFFDEKSLQFFIDSFQQLNINKIICIGAPRLHAYIRQQCQNKIKSFLLDYDKRFYYFYDDKEFAWYNMCNNYFFDNENQMEFKKFLKLQENENLLIFTDPPFGCRTETIAHTIKQLFKLFAKINNFIYSSLAVFWIFPYFFENYIQNVMPEMEMCDYKVSYTNHETYHNGNKGRKLGSPVRLFTNITLNLFKLPADENYKFCQKCKRWTAVENIHCDLCKNCPSKNGDTYRHCHQCGICVKPNYVHCLECRRCTQKNQHKCDEYQKTIRCWICKNVGHNEKACFILQKYFKKKKIKTKDGYEPIVCLLCNQKNHNEKNCLNRGRYFHEEYFMGQTEKLELKKRIK